MPSDEFYIDAGTDAVKLIFKDGGLLKNIETGADKTRKAASLAARRMAPQVESYMKINAPWTDRTGNARNGLAARAYDEREEIGIILYHQVTYGIWLETRFSGKYAIINPTIEAMGPQVMAAFDRILDRI